MKVLILAKDAHIGGLVTSTETLSRGLKEYKGIDSVIGMPIGSGVGFRMDGLCVEEINFDRKSPLSIYENYKIISNIINRYEIDMIHCQNRIPALYAAVYCFFHKAVRYIWVNHQVPIPTSFIYKITTKYGYCAVTDCVEGKSLLEKGLGIPQSKTKVINLGLDLSKYTRTSLEEQKSLKKKLGIKDNEKVIFLYGRLTESKGHKFLLNSISKIHDKNFKLIFPGESNNFKEEVACVAASLGLQENIIFPGYVKGNDYLSVSNLMVLPSCKESFSYSCVEAFCVGVPVIRTTTGGYEDMKDLCWGVKYGDENGLANLLDDFMRDDNAFIKKANVAKDLVNRFSLRTMVDSYYRLYTEAVNS